MKKEIIRSKRKTVALQIRPDGTLLVRAPRYMPAREIDRYIKENKNWIEKHLEQIKTSDPVKKQEGQLSQKDIEELKAKARPIICARVEYYAKMMGISYGRVAIRCQKTRWGSCSSKGNLNFNCLLTLMPPEILDYVVVHELAHRKELNHSAAFWSIVEDTLPDYRERKTWLAENGIKYIRTVP